MKVTATRATYVETDKGDVLLQPGDSADVDGRKYGNGHPFIKAGYLVPEKAEEKPKRQKKTEPEKDEQVSGSSAAGEE